MQETDGNLLTRFANHRDEAAFGELAARHLGLIYHVALRRTGDRQMAQEISQNVLCAVVRKASALARHPDRFPAWLHRATLFESSKAMRSEASHQRRKQLVHPDAIRSTGGDDSAAWNAAMPWLDLALDRLPDRDRRIVLRHYFEGKSFNQIGAEVSRPAATVQKQCRRAIEKLARILRGKGAALPVALLASGLGTQSAKAAPPALLKSVAAKALGGAASYSTTSLTLFMAMKSKAALPIALLVLLSPLGLQQLAIFHAAAYNEDLRESLAASAFGVRRPSARPVPRSISAGPKQITIHMLRRAQEEADQSRLKQFELDEMVASLSPEQLEKLIPQCIRQPGPWDGRNSLLRQLVRALAKTDPGLAVRTVSSADPQQPVILNDGVEQAIFRWANSEPDQAVEWLKAMLQKPAGSHWHGFVQYQAAVAASLILSDSPLASEVITLSDNIYPSDVLRQAMRVLYGAFCIEGSLGRKADVDFMAGVFSKFLPWIRELPPEDRSQGNMERERRDLLSGLLTWSEGSVLESPLHSTIMETVDLLPSERRIIAETNTQRILGPIYNTQPRPDRYPLEHAAREWLETHMPEAADEIFEQSLSTVTDQARRQEVYRLESLAGREVIRDSDLIWQLENLHLREFPDLIPQALEQAQRIKDPAKRSEMINQLQESAR